MSRSTIVPFLLLSLSLGVNACSNSTGPQTTSLILPGVGSYYVIHAFDYDSSGKIISGAEWYDTIKVVKSGVAYMGRSNGIEISVNNDDSSCGGINYESNGDLSVYKVEGSQGEWITFPISTKGKSLTVFDAWEADTCVFMRETALYIQSQTLRCYEFKIIHHYLSSSDDYIEFMWIAPEIGFWVKSLENFLPQKGGKEKDVIGYLLK